MFSYNYRQRYWASWKDTLHWLFCEWCCCKPCNSCRKKRKLANEERLFIRAKKKLYTEIDLLEVVKQLRISRFMSQIHLTQNQRELVKFFRSYVISLQKKKVVRHQTSEVAPSLMTSHVNPADETLLQFMPDKDPVDKRLFDNIIEPDTKRKPNRPLSVSAYSKKSKTPSDILELDSENNPGTDQKDDQDLIVSTSSEEDDEDDDVGDLYKVGGKRGF